MRRLFCFLVGVVWCVGLVGQSNEELYLRASRFKAEYKYREALPLYEGLLRVDSNNVNYLSGASYCFTKYAYYYLPEGEKMGFYVKAGYLARKAIRVNETSGEAHCAYAMALGRIYENASSKVKIANSKVIKGEVDRAIVLNPRLAGAYHILGRWHRTIAGFNGFEKAMINTFFGGVPPGGTYDDAVRAFMTAITIEPKFMLHQYELAETYYEMGKLVEARLWVNKALELVPVCEDDVRAKLQCEELLKKLK